MLTRSRTFHALAHRRRYWGAPRAWTYLNAALCAVPLLGWHLMIFIPIFMIGQYIAYLLCARDPERVGIYLKYMKQADNYMAYTPIQKYMRRPQGFGREHPQPTTHPHAKSTF